MKSNSGPSISCRHPKVVMLIDNEEDIAGAAKIIVEQVEEYRTILFSDSSIIYIGETKPSVLLVAMTNVEKSVKVYKELVEKDIVNYPHYSVILCNNKESNLAFRCCIKGVFDNYFVYQPLYERYRLKMIIHNGLRNSQTSNDYKGIQEEQLEEIDERLGQLIEESSECKNKLLDQIKASREELEQASEQFEQQSNLSTKDIVCEITEGHVKPLLNTLENDIKSSLDGIIEQLLSQRLTQMNRSQTAIEANDKEGTNSEQAPKHGILRELPKKITPLKDASRILVVEDNQLYRDMLVNVLSNEKYSVDEVGDGIQAIHKIKNSEYDLIIMDLFMPNLDGLNATKQIRTVSGGKDIPVIALTGNKNKEIVRKWASYGLKGYITKPSTKEQILAAVSKCVI